MTWGQRSRRQRGLGVSCTVPELRNYPLRDLARLWAAELAEVGFGEVDTGSSAVAKRGERAYDPRLETLGGDLHPVRLEESQRVAWLNLDGERTTKGYKNIEVLDKTLATDQAFIAALSALEGSRVRRFSELPLMVRTRLENPPGDEANSMSLREVVEELQGELSAEHNFGNLELSSSLETLDYPLDLLGKRRQNFDRLPYEEQLALLKGTCERIHEFSEALRKLVRFVEFGTFDPAKGKAELRTRITQNAQRYIRAAILRDVEGFSHLELAKELNEPTPPTYYYKKDIPAVRDLYKKGREILEQALGADGWKRQAETMKTEIEWWNSLNSYQKEADRLFRSTLPGSLEAARQLRELFEDEENYKRMIENVEREDIERDY